jgi:allantoin racemase
MKLGLINPNTSPEMTAAMTGAAEEVTSSGTELVALTASDGPASIDGYVEDLAGANAVVALAHEHGSTLDGLVIGCFGDPGLAAARELLQVPVAGAAQAAMMAAACLGHRFSILTTLDSGVPLLENVVRHYGFQETCASVRAVGSDVATSCSDPELATPAFAAAGRRALTEDGAEVLCLGCAGLSELRPGLEHELGVPVVDAVPAAVSQAESLVRLGLRTSKSRGFRGPTSAALPEAGEPAAL